MKEIIPNFDSYLNENPDTANFNRVYLTAADYDSYAFGEFKGVMYISHERGTHYDLGKNIPEELWNFGKSPERWNLINCGRLWSEYKFISFWDVETKLDMKLIKKINEAFKHLDIKIDNTWYVEVQDLTGFNKADVLSIKNAITSDKKRYNINWKQ
jgi:hypothetical protein